MTINKKIILPILILIVGVIGFAGLRMSKPQQAPASIEERVWRVQVMEAIPRTLAPTLTLYGQVETPDMFKAASPGDAVVSQMHVREGQRVDQGRLLMSLDERDFLPALEQAQAEVEELKAQTASELTRHQSDLKSLEQERQVVRLAQASVQRNERLKQQNLGSDSAVDEARQNAVQQALKVTARQYSIDDHAARLKQLQARLKKAQARLQDAELDFERSRVISPFPGVVSKVLVAKGDRVKTAETLLEMYSLDDMEVRARIPAPYKRELRASLNEQQPVYGFTDRQGAENPRLRLDRFSGQADPSGIDGLFGFEAGAKSVRVGEMLRFQIERPARRNVVAVPYRSIYGSNRLYLMDDDRMKGIEVEVLGSYIGDKDEERLLVASEQIKPGDRIVVTHLPNAISGLRVEAVQ
ncbi:MAG: biotin/lipoyl-binding protein [Pseudomonadota bacterium]